MKNNFYEMMRIGKVHTRDVDRLSSNRQKRIDQQKNLIGSAQYDINMKSIDEQFKSDVQRKREVALHELESYAKDVRKNVKDRLTKAPTDEQMRLFSAIGQLENFDHRLASLFTPVLCDTQIGCELYSQILAKHQMNIPVPSIEAQLNAPEVVIHNIAAYIQNYTGEDSLNYVMIKELHDLYFQPEDFYSKTDIKSSEKALQHFWDNKVGIGTPALLDDENPDTKNIQPKYFFTDMDGVIDFINEKTKGMEGREKEDMVTELMEHFPDTYAAQYRYYLSTGKKQPLIEDRQVNGSDDGNQEV